MESVTLRAETKEGLPLKAVYCPGKGMNLVSYRWGDIELIAQDTLPLFEDHCAGLGALIGPHFHHRRKEVIPLVPHEEHFLHIARVRARGVAEPFSHGIARYAPWQHEVDGNRIVATLEGKSEWNGVALKELEGQNFRMQYTAELTEGGLAIDYSIISDSDSLVGLHYYYTLVGGKGAVMAKVKNQYLDQGQTKQIPSSWNYDTRMGLLNWDCIDEADYGFHPFADPLNGSIALKTGSYFLQVQYSCTNAENQWQLYHPRGASFVCIEPMSAANPRKPQLTVSGLHVDISVSAVVE
ncbi:hypothetical protein JYU14_04055 [Simkania negevensis]|uniref:Aldose 1-epimerase n=1 Tax=Simkania negevensis TaxID=83561 RepID=A0ABS3AUE1_9BACT|nr:hypothetical protein [Simkania negevensis]